MPVLFALSFVLSQLKQDRHDKPIAFFLKTLDSHKTSYNIIVFEYLAVTFGIKECFPYMYRSKFSLVLDPFSKR